MWSGFLAITADQRHKQVAAAIYTQHSSVMRLKCGYLANCTEDVCIFQLRKSCVNKGPKDLHQKCQYQQMRLQLLHLQNRGDVEMLHTSDSLIGKEQRSLAALLTAEAQVHLRWSDVGISNCRLSKLIQIVHYKDANCLPIWCN